MLTPISSSAIPSYPIVQKAPTPLLPSLPVEIREEIEGRLDPSVQHALFKALTTATRNSEPVDSPALKLYLMQQRIALKYHQTLASSDASLRAFALNQLQRLWESGQLDQVVEKKPAFFELLRLVDDPAIFGFLKEKIQEAQGLKKKLVNWVERSKTDEVQLIAANALTLLAKAGVALTGQDFKGIRVPGADLSYGIFDHTQFEGADLSGVNFRGACLREANLQKANLAGVNFGEWPSIEVDSYYVVDFCYTPDGRLLAVGTYAGAIKLYHTETLELMQTLEGHNGGVNSVNFSPAGDVLASGGDDSMVKLWSVESGEMLRTLGGHDDYVTSVNFSPAGDVLASGSEDSTVKLWSVESGEMLRTLGGHGDYVTSVNFSPAGDVLASGSKDNTVKLWSVESGEMLRILQGHSDGVMSVNFSPTGDILASGSKDNTVKLWSVESGEMLRTLEGHSSYVTSVNFSPVGDVLASGSMDDTVKLWGVESGEELRTFQGHSDYVTSVNFSPAGDVLASGSKDDTVKLRQVEPKENDWKVGLYWTPSSQNELTLTDMSIQDAQGLSLMNKILLKQKDTRGEPAPVPKGYRSGV